MKHVRQISVARAEAKDDGAEALFFQLYFYVIGLILSAAITGK